MGGNWGVFDSDGQAKFPATGPVAEDPYWYLGWLGAVIGLAAALGLSRRWQLTERLSQVQVMALGAATGGLVVAQLRYGMVWNRNPLEWGATVLLGAASLVLMFRVAQLLALGRSDRPVGQGASSLVGLAVPSFNTLWRRRRAHFDALDWLGVCRSFLLFAAAIMTLLLVFDARYRGFPTVLYMLPLLGLAMARLAGLRLAGAVEERVLAAVCVLGSIAFVFIEGFANGQSLTFGATVVALAAVATDGRFWMPAQDEH